MQLNCAPNNVQWIEKKTKEKTNLQRDENKREIWTRFNSSAHSMGAIGVIGRR